MGCHQSTFYDSVSGHCVMTCPSGTYGVVNGASDDVSVNHTRNCTSSEQIVMCSVMSVCILMPNVYKWLLLFQPNDSAHLQDVASQMALRVHSSSYKFCYCKMLFTNKIVISYNRTLFLLWPMAKILITTIQGDLCCLLHVLPFSMFY